MTRLESTRLSLSFKTVFNFQRHPRPRAVEKPIPKSFSHLKCLSISLTATSLFGSLESFSSFGTQFVVVLVLVLPSASSRPGCLVPVVGSSFFGMCTFN